MVAGDRTSKKIRKAPRETDIDSSASRRVASLQRPGRYQVLAVR